jgi:hypothetical protein
MPCQACLEVADAEFFVTNRLGVPWTFEQSTVALCVPCFIRVGIAMGEALQAAYAEMEAQAPPEVLEQLQANEAAEPEPESEPKRSRKRATQSVQTVTIPAVPEEAPASDD